MKSELAVVSKEYTDSIDAQYQLVGEAVVRAQTYLAENNADEGVIALCAMIITEALNNIIEHAYANAMGSIDLGIKMSEYKLIFTFIDNGTPAPKHLFDGAHHMPTPEDLPESGWGLALIHTIVDEVSYRYLDDTNYLKLSINI